MKRLLSKEKFGVAIAAPQIGESLRIFVVTGKVFAALEEPEDTERKANMEAPPDRVFINPKMLKISKKQQVSSEGCLSIPGKYGTKVKRAEKITINYKDERNVEHEHGATGFLAQVFQHEIDHLNGVLYTDNALEVIDVDENLKPLGTEHDVLGMRDSRT